LIGKLFFYAYAIIGINNQEEVKEL
jgi:hypothetical protein